LTETKKKADSVLLLPTGTSMEREAIEKICHVVRFLSRNGFEVTSRMRGRISAQYSLKKQTI